MPAWERPDETAPGKGRPRDRRLAELAREWFSEARETSAREVSAREVVDFAAWNRERKK